MKMHWTPLVVTLLAATLAIAQAPARADDTTDVPLKIAICNPLKVATQLQEYKDMVEKVKADSTSLEAQLEDRKEKIKSMSDELKLILPDSPAYAEKNQALIQAQIDMEVWAKMQQIDQTRKQKVDTKALFDKINVAIAQIAHDRGYTLVLSDHSADIPDNLDDVTPEQLNNLLIERTILFEDSRLDITQDVVIALDKQYTANH
jgi:Skp family chaperone for outer membrane proteins